MIPSFIDENKGENEMKKIFTFLLSMLLILSLIPCFSLVSSLHEKEKLHISFSKFSEEELTEMTTGEDGYHIAVFVAFSYENMNDEALASLSTEAKRTAVYRSSHREF